MISPLGYKILIELPVVGQDTIVSSASLPLSREVLSNYTKFVSKVLKLYMRQRLVNTSATCSFVPTYWSFIAPLCTISRM
jgi:hypothetical protein